MLRSEDAFADASGDIHPIIAVPQPLAKNASTP